MKHKCFFSYHEIDRKALSSPEPAKNSRSARTGNLSNGLITIVHLSYRARGSRNHIQIHFGGVTGISSEIRTKLRDWAVLQARASCYSQAALYSNDSKTLYLIQKNRKFSPPAGSCLTTFISFTYPSKVTK